MSKWMDDERVEKGQDQNRAGQNVWSQYIFYIDHY